MVIPISVRQICPLSEIENNVYSTTDCVLFACIIGPLQLLSRSAHTFLNQVDKNNILLYDPTHLTDYRRHKFSFYTILCSI